MDKNGVAELSPFAGIDAERAEIEELRREVKQLRKFVMLLVEGYTALMHERNAMHVSPVHPESDSVSTPANHPV